MSRHGPIPLPAPLPDDLAADALRQPAREPGALAPVAAVGLAMLALAGCSVVSGHFENTAGPQAGADTASAAPLACTAKGDVLIYSFFQSTQAQGQDQHTNPDGSIDSKSFAFGRQVDPTAGTAITTLGGLAGMLLKGGATVATGGAVPLTAVPQKDGSYRLQSVPQQQSAAPGTPAQATAAGCIPSLTLPGGGAGPARSRALPSAFIRDTPSPSTAEPWAPGWHRGVTGTRRLLLPPVEPGRVAYITSAGHSYDISTAAWLRWLAPDDTPELEPPPRGGDGDRP